jgi:hypothetical protein
MAVKVKEREIDGDSEGRRICKIREEGAGGGTGWENSEQLQPGAASLLGASVASQHPSQGVRVGDRLIAGKVESPGAMFSRGQGHS